MDITVGERYERTPNRGSRPKLVSVVYDDENVVVFRSEDPRLNRHTYSSYRMVAPHRFRSLYQPITSDPTLGIA